MSQHWLHVFATFDPGGPQVRATELFGLLGADVRHTVIAMDGATGACTRVAAGVRVDVERAPAGQGLWARSGAFARRFRELRPDLLLTYNFGAIEAVAGAWRAGQRALVHHEDGFGPEEAARLLARRNWARRLLLRAPAAVVVPSQGLARIATGTWWVPRGRVHHLANGVDLRRFRPRAQPVARAPVVIGSVGSFRAVKNQQLLLRAYAGMRLRDHARLLLVGDGPDRPACERLARELGIAERVTFRGAVDDTAPVYHEMDLLAVSSTTEQMPLAVLEAMASGLPIAATPVGDVEAMVHDLNRPYLAAFTEPTALGVGLDSLVSDADVRAAVGRANRERCEQHYEAQTCLGRYAALYREVAAGCRRGS